MLTVEVNPDGLLTQLYVSPVTDDAPIEADAPVQMPVPLPAFADGDGFTVITVLFEVSVGAEAQAALEDSITYMVSLFESVLLVYVEEVAPPMAVWFLTHW